MTSAGLAQLFTRDLTRLQQEIAAFSDDAALWRTAPGVTNPAGNLVLHLEGNLREFIGRQIAGIPYRRDRPAEFGAKGLTKSDLAARIAAIAEWLPSAVSQLDPQDLANPFPENVWNRPADQPTTNGQFLIHLYGHLNYHLGQIDYLRRVVTGNGAIEQSALK